MKQVSIFGLMLCIIVSFSSCNLPSQSTQDHTTNIYENGTVENGLTYHRFSVLPGAVGISEDYDAYSPEYGYTDEMLASQGISKDDLDLFLQTSGYDLIIVPKGEFLGAPAFEIDIRIKDEKDYGIDNLKDADEALFNVFAATFIHGFSGGGDPIPYTVYENDTAKYIVFDWAPITLQRRYATIINGKMVYFIAKAAGNPLSSDQEETLLAIIDSLQY